MASFLHLRLEAPMMSFGGPLVDNYGVTQDFPAASLLTGLLANALGYRHGDFDALQRLQERLLYGVRRDRAGRQQRELQTVDLGQPFMALDGWTTRGQVVCREGGPEARTGTHMRWRDHLVDAAYSVVLALSPAAEAPTLDEVAQALEEPARPLFIGRKHCLPSVPLFGGMIEAPDLRAALSLAPPPASPGGRDAGDSLLGWWPAEEGEGSETTLVSVTDRRDWRSQIHVGTRLLRSGMVPLTGGPHG